MLQLGDPGLEIYFSTVQCKMFLIHVMIASTMGHYNRLSVEEQERHHDQLVSAEELLDEHDEWCIDDHDRDTIPSPPPGSWAETARMMSELFKDVDWDSWKDEMKDVE